MSHLTVWKCFGRMWFFYLLWSSHRGCRGTNVMKWCCGSCLLRQSQYAGSVLHFSLCLHVGWFCVCWVLTLAAVASVQRRRRTYTCDFHIACSWLHDRVCIYQELTSFTWVSEPAWPKVMAMCGEGWGLEVNGGRRGLGVNGRMPLLSVPSRAPEDK